MCVYVTCKGDMKKEETIKAVNSDSFKSNPTPKFLWSGHVSL